MPLRRAYLVVPALVAVGGAIALWATRSGARSAAPPAQVLHARGYVGSASCGECHRHPHRRWAGSHHDHAMRKAAPGTALGDFEAAPLSFAGETSSFRRAADRVWVTTEGPDGRSREVPVEYTFGVWPLQQVLVPGEGGRRHAPLVSWDSRDAAQGGQRWFRLRPEDGRVPPTDLFHSFGPYQVWNSMCAECHSTGVRKNWDAARDRYETTWVEDGVGCEACHGPGAAHEAYERAGAAGTPPLRRGLAVSLKEKRPIAWTLDPRRGIWIRDPVGRPAEHADVCARCHSRRGTIAEEDAGAPLHDTHRVALLEEGLYFPDGQVQAEVFEHGSWLQTKMHAAGVGCFDCHGHASRARTGGAAEACANCHLRETFATPAHHFHEEGKPGSACVDCHMPTRTYMVVHARRDHAVRVPRPDLSLSLGTPNACNGCHADKDARWAADRMAKWWPAVATRPHYGTAIEAGRRGAPGAARALTDLLADPKVPAIVRGTAASLLGRNADPGTARVLETAGGDADPLVRRGVVEGAATLPPAERWRVIGRLLADPSRVVRIDAARHLAGPPPPTPADGERLAAALEEARAAAAWAADTPEGGMGVGHLALAEGDLAAAERAFQAVAASTPAFVPAWVNLADVQRMRGREPDVVRTLEEGRKSAPDDPALRHALGLALVRARRLPDAVPHLEAAAGHADADPRFTLAWGLYLVDAGQPQRGIAALEAALARRPYDTDLLLTLLPLRARAGDRAGTLDLLRRLEALRPWDGEVRAERERLENGR
ncbi:MAG TPA: tetratricopeptide repeat protein [Planctomycetota bacterium]|nr:tetratricopeptide repeat protein [Planctomycetota bacterium]